MADLLKEYADTIAELVRLLEAERDAHDQRWELREVVQIGAQVDLYHARDITADTLGVAWCVPESMLREGRILKVAAQCAQYVTAALDRQEGAVLCARDGQHIPGAYLGEVHGRVCTRCHRFIRDTTALETAGEAAITAGLRAEETAEETPEETAVDSPV